MFTSFYRASSSGKLGRTLRELQTCDYGTANLRCAIWGCVVFAWFMAMTSTAFVAYAFFSFDHIDDGFLTPLKTQIIAFNPNVLPLVRVVVALWYIHMNAAWSFAASTTFSLSGAFSQLFRIFNRNFKAAIDCDGKFQGKFQGKFRGSFDAHRLRHQRICRMVNAADKYLALYFATAVLTNIAAIITILFLVIWYPLINSPAFIGILIFWIVGSSVILVKTVIGSKMVNNQVQYTDLGVDLVGGRGWAGGKYIPECLDGGGGV